MAQLANALESVSNVGDKISTGSPRKEGALTKRVEEQTAKVPSIGYLGLAVASMVLSAGIVIFARRKEFANFVGLWAPSFMLIGIYNKLVKLEGSDGLSKSRS